MPEIDSSPDVTAVVGPESQFEGHSLPLLGTQLSAGQLLADRFEVRALAGVGGMGAVYRAWDRVTNATVALKMLSGQAADEERFTREARVLAELEHPSIVRYVAHGVCADGTPYLAMEWLDGTDLATRLVRHPLTMRESVNVVERVASALGLAHSRGIVHRDLSPRNLYLVHGSVTDVRVLDFGIAMLGSLATRITLSGSALGTPGYMAPEQAQGASLITPAADVFALGCVLFECLSGRRAFAGRTLMELLAKILVDDVPHLSALGVRVPPELDRLVASMLEKRAEARPRDGSVVAAVLRELAVSDDARPEPGPNSRASLTAVEQRVVSVILASDPIANAGDSNVVEQIGEIAGPFGARVEPLANGCVVITMGANSGPEGGRANASDRVVQAARCALAMRQRFPTLPLALGTGRSVVSGRWPAGQAIERASSFLRTVSDAPEPEPASGGASPIFVDEVTAGLLDARFDVRGDARGLMLRGLRDTQEPTRTLLGVSTPMVGRNRELLTLEATYQESAADSVARVVLLTCPAGFGKTRLAEEFLKKLRLSDTAPDILRAQADPLSKGSPFALIAQAIRHACGIIEGEDVAVRRQKLRARVARHVAEADSARVSEFLGELIGSPFPDENSAQLRAARNDAVLLGDQMLRAFEDWLEAESQQSPLLLVLDDLHWGDLPSVRFVDSVLRKLAERPLMVMAMARPEVHDLFPSLWSRRGMLEIRLPELSRKAAETLARQVLGPGGSETVIERIVARAGGNALWLEELLRAEVEGRGHESSDTVMVLAQARLEALDSDARLVLRAASVFGQRFSAAGVRALTGQVVLDLDSLLAHLVEREIVVARMRGSSSQREYEFRNALFRDAAYATLTDDDRELGHRLAAAWLKESGDAEALVLAEHFERGGRSESAVEWYLRAGQQALEGSDLEAAVARAQRGIDGGASREQRGQLRLLQAEACKWQGKNADCQRFALEAMECLLNGSPAWCAAVGEAAAASGKVGDLERCGPLSQALLDAALSEQNARALVIAMSRTATQLVLAGVSELASRLLARVESALQTVEADPATLGWVFEARAVSAGTGHDPSVRVSLAEQAAQSFTAAGDLRNACLQQTSLGFACVETGANAQAEQALSSALALGERLNLSNSIPIARAHLGRALSRRGENARARALLQQAVEAFDEQGNQRLGGMARCYLALVLVQEEQHELARRAAREAVLMLESFPAFRRSSLATLAAVSLSRGAVEDARESSEAAVTGLGRHDEVSFGESLVRLVHAETLHACGEIDAARMALSIARDRLLERAGRIRDPERRHAFLTGVPENARTLALVADWSV